MKILNLHAEYMASKESVTGPFIFSLARSTTAAFWLIAWVVLLFNDAVTWAMLWPLLAFPAPFWVLHFIGFALWGRRHD